MIEAVKNHEARHMKVYVSVLHTLTVPLQDIRRKMDTCSSVTAEITAVLTECYREIDNR